MNLYDIPRAITECTVILGESLHSELICSSTVNGLVLAAVLLGVIRLMDPICSKGLGENSHNQAGHS